MGNIKQINGALSGLFLLIMFVLVVSVTNGHAKALQNEGRTNYTTAFTLNNSYQNDGKIQVTLDLDDVDLSEALLKFAKKANVGLSLTVRLSPQRRFPITVIKKDFIMSCKIYWSGQS